MGEYWLKGKKSSRFPTIPTHGIDEPHISIFFYLFILYSHYLVGNHQVLKLLTPILCEGEEHPRICKSYLAMGAGRKTAKAIDKYLSNST